MQGEKIPVGVLGATGTVGQRLISLLHDHPWFEVVGVTSSSRSTGKPYGDAVRWSLPDPIPPAVAEMRLCSTEENPPSAPLLFSALPSAAAARLEPALAQHGHIICSNASAHRMDVDVPLLIPEINPHHLALIERQRRERGWNGLIVTSPNCSTTGVVFPLFSLHRAFGLRQAHVVTLQAISGAGRSGLAALEIQDNVLPFIAGEEGKVESEPKKILASTEGGALKTAEFTISAQCHRVPVSDGHLAAISVELVDQPDLAEVEEAISGFEPAARSLDLPSSPSRAMFLRRQVDRPQVRLDRDAGRGMAVTVGRLQDCPVLDFKMVSLVHNSLRGAAGGALLNAELLVEEGYLREAAGLQEWRGGA